MLSKTKLPPQKIRIVCQGCGREGYSFAGRLRLILALLQFRPCPRIELATLPQLSGPPFSSVHCSSDPCACQMQAALLSKQGQFFFARRRLCLTFAQFQFRCRLLQHDLRIHLIGGVPLPHLVFEFAGTQASRQCDSRTVLTDYYHPSPAAYRWFLPVLLC